MSETTIVALDAMGGDNAPQEIVKGAVNAIKQRKDIKVLLVGKEEILKDTLKAYEYPKEQLEIVNATEEIEMAESPVLAIRRKKDSSMSVAMKLVHDKKADAVVSAGNSGAVLVGGQILVGKIKGVERTPLAPLIPTAKGVSLLIDCGHIPGACRAHRKVGGFPRQVTAVGHGAAQLVKVGPGHRAGQFPAAMGRAEPDDVGNAVDQHGGLAGARACQNEQRPLGSKDGLTLHRVEPGKPGFDILVAQGKIFSGNIGHNNDLSLVIYIIR